MRRVPSRDDIFDRINDQQELLNRLQQRRTFLVHGESGVGKSFLLTRLCREIPDLIYCSSANGIQGICLPIALQCLQSYSSLRVELGKRPETRLKGMSSTSLRGIVTNVLGSNRHSVLLDHFGFASQQVASMLKGWISAGTPVIVVARSTHMEEIGYAASLFVERRDKFVIGNFDLETAMQFTDWLIDKHCLQAANLEDFKRRTVDMSRGNPGLLVKLVEWAALPRYRSGDHIKVTPLYLDVKLHATNPSR